MANDHDILEMLKGTERPCAWVDHERLTHNIHELAKHAQPLKIRIASKSVRVRQIITELLNDHPDIFHGVLAFHPDEALWLARNGIKDIVVGYPYIEWFQRQHAHDEAWDQITFMADRSEHLEAIHSLAKRIDRKVNICFDIDLSTKHFGVHFGVYRSSLRTLESMSLLLDQLDEMPGLNLRGLMGYEAQIAGVGDANPFKKALNPAVAMLKKRSWPTVKHRRQSLVTLCKERGHKLEFVNGGGTGSLQLTKTDASVTEVAAGSGLFTPLLFDYYRDFKLQAAAGFALEVTRNPYPNTVTVAGGGYIASGAIGADKLPRPAHSHHLELEANEGAGEVQTPLHGKHIPELGSSVLFRHAKAGELCERFNHVLYLNGGDVKKLATYRGEGQCFL